MWLDADDLYLEGILEAVFTKHRETGADVVQFQAMKCEFGKKPKFWSYRPLPDHVLNNTELNQAVKHRQLMWNLWSLSVRRELYEKVFAYLDVRWMKYCMQEEDRLISYMVFYFAEGLAPLPRAGYLYVRYGGKELGQVIQRARHLREVRKYLQVVYQYPLLF
jgi:hypothetical protein